MSDKRVQRSRNESTPETPGELDLGRMAEEALEQYRSYFKSADLSDPAVRKEVFSSELKLDSDEPNSELTVFTFSADSE